VTIFRCTGRLVFGYADALLNAISKVSCPQIALLDLSEVTEIDASGIGALISVRRLAKASGVALKLMNLTPSVEDLLELTRLTPAFEICSVPGMLDLLCRAFEQSQFARINTAVEGSDRALDTPNACSPKPHRSSATSENMSASLFLKRLHHRNTTGRKE